MKIPCKVHGKDALVVGYAQGRRAKALAVVICEGELRSVKLKDVVLAALPEELRAKGKVVELPKDRKA